MHDALKRLWARAHHDGWIKVRYLVGLVVGLSVVGALISRLLNAPDSAYFGMSVGVVLIVLIPLTADLIRSSEPRQ